MGTSVLRECPAGCPWGLGEHLRGLVSLEMQEPDATGSRAPCLGDAGTRCYWEHLALEMQEPDATGSRAPCLGDAGTRCYWEHLALEMQEPDATGSRAPCLGDAGTRCYWEHLALEMQEPDATGSTLSWRCRNLRLGRAGSSRASSQDRLWGAAGAETRLQAHKH
ncbi:hypothetical protein NDU88_000026 [Pleurodeles waltl]|uniref:Uncharacterized protein n=1 Tax=Pleurodeles waltl TaxID=8319 RepID=A0AAV7LGX0_PLEWA|nr:hypothetical protein NDU88_000026 [Pleurodeles waltl]